MAEDEPTAPPPSPPPPPHAGSLCLDCRFHRLIETRTSTFVMCGALPVKYPRQPVTVCPAFERGHEGG